MSDGLTVVGAGRIGGMIIDLAARQGLPCEVVGRDGPTTAPDGSGLVVVCSRNDALPDVIARTAAGRRADLVFVQNGVLAPYLRNQGLTDWTLGVLYVAVDRRGATPVPGAPSVFGGRHAAALADLLQAGGVDARVAADDDDLRAEVGTKLAWICVTGVLGQALGVPVGDLLADHAADMDALCAELAPVLAAHADTAAAPDLADRVRTYSASVAHYRTTVKEWRWRNGWLLAQATRFGVDLPLHRRWLARAGIDDQGRPLAPVSA